MANENDPNPDASAIESWCREAAEGNVDSLQRLLAFYHNRLIAYVRLKIGVDWQGKIDPEDVFAGKLHQGFQIHKKLPLSG